MYRILHANDTPHRIALGAAVGGLIAWTPTIGFQMLLAVVLTSAIGANRLVSIIIVWVSNPLTLIPIYFPNYLVGHALLEIFTDRPELSYDQLRQTLTAFNSLGDIANNLFDWQFWYELTRFLLNISLDLWVGSIVVGLFLSVVFYIITYKWVVWYRTHTRLGRRHAARMQRAQNEMP